MAYQKLVTFKNARSKSDTLPTLTSAYDKDSNGGLGDTSLAVSELADFNSAEGDGDIAGYVRVDHESNGHSYYYSYTARSATSGAGNLTGLVFVDSTNSGANADLGSGCKVYAQELVAQALNRMKARMDEALLDQAMWAGA